MKNILNQLMIGVWGSLAVFMGVTTRSWESAIACLICGLFLGGIMLASNFIRSDKLVLQKIGFVAALGYGVVFIAGVLFTAERLYFVNGDTYPVWLAKKDLGVVAADQLFAGYRSECQGKTAEIIVKNDLAVVRCGEIFWYEADTFILHLDEGRK